MFTLPHNTIAFFYKEAIDMRLGMFRLQGVIAEHLHQSMQAGRFFLFINKPHTLLKADKWLQIHPSALALLLDGIELKKCGWCRLIFGEEALLPDTCGFDSYSRFRNAVALNEITRRGRRA